MTTDDVVVTGTRTRESTHKATVRTDVVTYDEATRRGATNVGEALAGQLGVQVNPGAYGFLGGPSAIQIFGFDRDRVLILEDGERAIGDVGGAIDLASVPLTDVARIEVVPGPTSALYGASAIGGVVNILSAPPETMGASGRFRIEGRSRRWVLMQGTAAYRSAHAWIALDGSYARRDGVARGDRPDLLIPASQRGLFGLRAGVNMTERAELRVRLRFVRDAYRGLETQDVPGLGTYFVDLPERNDRIALHVVESIDLGSGSSVRLSLARQWFDGDSRDDRRDSPLDEIRRRHQTLSSFEATLVEAVGKSTWIAGIRAESESAEQSLEKTAATDAKGTLATTEAPEVKPVTLGYAAAYAQASLKPSDAITILLGLRGEIHRRWGGVAAPRLAIALRPSEGWTFRIGGGRGFRAPSAKELGFTFDHSFYGYRVDGNTELRPETSWGINGDLSHRFADRMLLRLGGFSNWVSNLIDITATGERTASGVDVYRYRNASRARTAGGQVDLSWPLRDWMRVELGYSYLWTRDDASDRPLPSRPPHTLVSAGRFNLPHDFELHLRWRLVSDAFVDDGVRSPAFQTFDARVGKGLGNGFQAYLGVNNAFDVKPTPGRVGDQRPIDGRIFYLGLRAELPAED